MIRSIHNRIPRVIRLGSTSVYSVDTDVSSYRDLAVLKESIVY